MTHTPSDARGIVLQCPSDIGIRNTARKATLDAPERLLDRVEHADVFVDELFPDEFDLKASQTAIHERATELLSHGKTLISIGGDHSVTHPLLAAAKERWPELRVVWIDAHYDLKEPRMDAGVPHDAVIRALVDDGIFDITEFCFIGVRESDPDEDEYLFEHETIELGQEKLLEIDTRDIAYTVRDLLGIEEDTPIYISIDIDAIDAESAPGTTFPSADGLRPKEVERLVRGLAACNVVGADLVEVAPALDEDEQTQEYAAGVLDELIDDLFPPQETGSGDA